jgi:hypothetical protein
LGCKREITLKKIQKTFFKVFLREKINMGMGREIIMKNYPIIEHFISGK